MIIGTYKRAVFFANCQAPSTYSYKYNARLSEHLHHSSCSSHSYDVYGHPFGRLSRLKVQLELGGAESLWEEPAALLFVRSARLPFWRFTPNASCRHFLSLLYSSLPMISGKDNTELLPKGNISTNEKHSAPSSQNGRQMSFGNACCSKRVRTMRIQSTQIMLQNDEHLVE